MNEKQIAFIMCINNEQEYNEALYYIEQLDLPDGFTKDIITIKDAPSMAFGYQAAMQSSTAKYKVYMHQDVFIYNRDFIRNIIDIFEEDKQIGAIGVIGRECLPSELSFAADWNVGNIYFNGVSPQIEQQNYEKWPMTVDAVDGLLIVTQYDIGWRDDIFDGWDFYDISQCMEFKRAGYRIVVPYQEKPWCYHDNYYSRLKKYFFYQDKFCKEYQDVSNFNNLVQEYSQIEIEGLMERMTEQLEIIVNDGQAQQLWDIFVEMEGFTHLALRDFRLLAQIDHLERINLKESIFWQEGESWKELSYKICDLKFRIKRMEFGLEEFYVGMEAIYNKYSIFAVAAITLQYASDRHFCVERIGRWYTMLQNEDMQKIWNELTKE